MYEATRKCKNVISYLAVFMQELNYCVVVILE